MTPTIGIITALEHECIAMKAMLDDCHEHDVDGKRGAGRKYFRGTVPGTRGTRHQVALALAQAGNNIASARATLLLEHFQTVDAIIMVGIAGAAPHPTRPEEHVRLGDVVVSNEKGVIQYDFVRETNSGAEDRFPPRPPSARLLEAVHFLSMDMTEGKWEWLRHLDRATHLQGFSRPSVAEDVLSIFIDEREVTLTHPADPQRVPDRPRVFYGPIASANKLLKNSRLRDTIRDKYGVKAVEMEGSGIADATWLLERGYLVVRGTCDYCDPNKGDRWQKHAAVLAAAYTRSLLERVLGEVVPAPPPPPPPPTALQEGRVEGARVPPKLIANDRSQLAGIMRDLGSRVMATREAAIVKLRDRADAGVVDDQLMLELVQKLDDPAESFRIRSAIVDCVRAAHCRGWTTRDMFQGMFHRWLSTPQTDGQVHYAFERFFSDSTEAAFRYFLAGVSTSVPEHIAARALNMIRAKTDVNPPNMSDIELEMAVKLADELAPVNRDSARAITIRLEGREPRG